jgi:hypothetical protein
MIVAVSFVAGTALLGGVGSFFSIYGYGLSLIALACILLGAGCPHLYGVLAAPVAVFVYCLVYGLFTQPAGVLDLTNHALAACCTAVFCFLLTGLFAILSNERTPEAHRCAQCDYLLVGLTEPRCPECGTPFDRDKLGAVTDDS